MATELRYDIATDSSEEIEYTPAPTIPETVTRRQAKHALLDANLLHLVEPAIAALPSPDRERAQIDWADAVEFRRDSPMVALLGLALGLNSEQIDALFIAAETVI